MVFRIVLLAFTLLMTVPFVANGKVLSGLALCHRSNALGRELWLHQQFDVSPEVDRLMVDTIDGKLPKVRRALASMTPEQGRRWRQVAMLVAARAGQPTLVDALLHDGAAVAGKAWFPPYKPAIYKQAKVSMDRSFGGEAAETLETAGAMKNTGEYIGPALVYAVGCADVATVDVLLRHRANVMARPAPNVIDALTEATSDGDAPIVQHLLDHGADPCVFDRHVIEFHRVNPTRPMLHTLAQIGSRAKLPAALVARLACPALTTTH